MPPPPRFPAGTLFHVYGGHDGYFLVKQSGRTLRILKRGEKSYVEGPLFLPSQGYRTAAAYFAALPADTPVRIEIPEGYDVDEVKKTGAAYGEWISEWVLRPFKTI